MIISELHGRQVSGHLSIHPAHIEDLSEKLGIYAMVAKPATSRQRRKEIIEMLVGFSFSVTPSYSDSSPSRCHTILEKYR